MVQPTHYPPYEEDAQKKREGAKKAARGGMKDDVVGRPVVRSGMYVPLSRERRPAATKHRGVRKERRKVYVVYIKIIVESYGHSKPRLLGVTNCEQRFSGPLRQGAGILYI